MACGQIESAVIEKISVFNVVLQTHYILITITTQLPDTNEQRGPLLSRLSVGATPHEHARQRFPRQRAPAPAPRMSYRTFSC